MSDTEYCYPPDYTILKNKFNLRDADQLDRFEHEAVMQRIAEGVPVGDFDLTHLRAIHRHLFQDVYDWAPDRDFKEWQSVPVSPLHRNRDGGHS